MTSVRVGKALLKASVAVFALILALSAYAWAGAPTVSYNRGMSQITYGQSTFGNVVVGVPSTDSLVANVVGWCKQSAPPPAPCIPPLSVANTVVANALAGNALSLTVNVLSYNTLSIAFGGLTYNVVMPLATVENAVTIMSSNADVANSVYGGWVFNGIITDTTTNTVIDWGGTGGPANSLVFLAMPATPQLGFEAPGGFLGLVSDHGNDSVSVINLVPSNIVASSTVASIHVASPGGLLLPPDFLSAGMPSVVGVLSTAFNSVSIVDTATRQVVQTKNVPNPVAMAFAPNQTSFNFAIASFQSGQLVIELFNPASNHTASIATNVPAGGAVSMSTYFNGPGSNSVLYVSDGNSNSVISVNLDSLNPNDVGTINLNPQSGPYAGQGADPRGIAAAPWGYVYVADYGTNDIAIINATSQKPGVMGRIQQHGPGNCNLDGPYALLLATAGSPELYATNYEDNSIAVFNPFGPMQIGCMHTGNVPVTEPDYLTLSPDGSLLYVPNFATNNIAVMDIAASLTGLPEAYLPANEPEAFAVMQNMFYNGSSPGNVVFTLAAADNALQAQLSAANIVVGAGSEASNPTFTLIGTANSVSNSITVLSTAGAGALVQSFMFTTPGDQDYMPGFVQKSFGVIRTFPRIAMSLTYNSGTGNTVIILDNNSASNTIAITANSFPITLSANVATVANQLNAGLFISGNSLGSFNGIFSQTWNALSQLGYGTQTMVFNSPGGNNYLPVDPEIILQGPTTTSTSTTTTSVPTTAGGGGTAGGGAAAPSSVRPTIEAGTGSATMYNMSTGASEKFAINGAQFTVGQNFVDPGYAGVSVNGNGYTLTNSSNTIELPSVNGTAYYLRLVGIDYYDYKVGAPTDTLTIYAAALPIATTTINTTSAPPLPTTTTIVVQSAPQTTALTTTTVPQPQPNYYAAEMFGAVAAAAIAAAIAVYLFARKPGKLGRI